MSSYFSSQSIFKSLANVAESQLTYTILSGDIASIVSRHFSSQPFLGGSTTITSGRSISVHPVDAVSSVIFSVFFCILIKLWKHLLSLSYEKLRICDAIELRIVFGILDCLRHYFHSVHLLCLL